MTTFIITLKFPTLKSHVLQFNESVALNVYLLMKPCDIFDLFFAFAYTVNREQKDTGRTQAHSITHPKQSLQKPQPLKSVCPL